MGKINPFYKRPNLKSWEDQVMYNKSKMIFSFEIFVQVPYDPPMSPHAQQYFGASGRFDSLRRFPQTNRYGSPQPDVNVPQSYQTSGKCLGLKYHFSLLTAIRLSSCQFGESAGPSSQLVFPGPALSILSIVHYRSNLRWSNCNVLWHKLLIFLEKEIASFHIKIVRYKELIDRRS